MRPAAILALAGCLLVAAGAVTPAAAAPGDTTSSIATDSATVDNAGTNTAPAPSLATTAGNNTTAESPVTGLSLFTVSDPTPPPLRIGFSVVNDTEFAFAAYVDGEFVGGTSFTDLAAGSSVDGYEVPVEANLTGEHRVTVYAVRNSNDNGVADAEDEPYTRNGSEVKASGTYTFDSTGGVNGLAFYTGYSDDPSPIQIGFGVEPNTTVAFVLYADGELVGHTEYEHYERALHADGMEVPLEQDLTGEVELTVVALQDTNGNGEVDAGDEPYLDGRERAASTMTVYFRDGSGTSDGTTSTTPGDGTTASTSTEESGGVAGFGLLSAVSALAAVVLGAATVASRRP